jgi:hypothetical protein
LKTTERVLAILAVLILITQTVRHAYVLWIESRASVLNRYDRPLHDRIADAKSLDELLKLYDPVRQEADRAKAANPQAEQLTTEPFRSEQQLRQAIEAWEEKAKELRALWFYWLVGLCALGLGVVLYQRGNRWAGLTLEITAFAEFIYWTSPSFFGGNVREFDRLLLWKFLLSIMSLALLVAVIRLQRVFSDATARVSGAA